MIIPPHSWHKDGGIDSNARGHQRNGYRRAIADAGSAYPRDSGVGFRGRLASKNLMPSAFFRTYASKRTESGVNERFVLLSPMRRRIAADPRRCDSASSVNRLIYAAGTGARPMVSTVMSSSWPKARASEAIS